VHEPLLEVLGNFVRYAVDSVEINLIAGAVGDVRRGFTP